VNTDVEDASSNMMRVEVTVEWQGPESADPITVTQVDWIAPN
jgi:hypothetical protein